MLPDKDITRIEDEAKKCFECPIENYLGFTELDITKAERKAYILGATYEAERAQRMAIEFANWLKHLDNGTTHHNPHTGERTESIGFNPFDCFTDDLKPVDELFTLFINRYKETTR